MRPEEVLYRYWGFKQFRPLQDEVIQAVLDGNDTLALMPTGGGKSICFQVPALCKEGICLVVTPLISLMRDQVVHLKKKGIPALAVHSGMHWREVEKTFKNALYGNFKFLYLSPERLTTPLFLDYLEALKINLLTVDEAHCISQWGYDFRPSYLRIGELRQYLPDTPVLAITATATRVVREDIQEKLLFRKKNVLVKSFFRKNLSYTAFEEGAKLNKVIDILNKVPGSSIIFCRSRKRTKEIASWLYQSGLQADYYHAGLDAEIRSQRQEAWINNKTRIIVCTNAFGMGIDKPDVRTVIHYDIPESPEAYYQEAGRAGRDGEKSFAILLYNDHEINTLEDKVDIEYPSLEKIKQIYRALVSYLNIPAGAGEGLYYDFDLRNFSRTFNLNILLVTHVLRILEQEEILSFNESVFLPSRICFTISKKELYRFEEDQPGQSSMIKCLLRTYEGIYDDYTPVSETQVARIVKSSQQEVIKSWQTLQRYGIIDYQQKKDKPQILFLQERIVVDQLQLDMKRINDRKNAFRKRIEAIKSYAENKEICRSKLLLAYFDEEESLPCGICDVCIVNKKKLHSLEAKQGLQRAIIQQIKNGSVTLAILLKQYSITDKEFVLMVLREMLDEEQISINHKQELVWQARYD